jgi:hypothetical protein
MMSVSIRYRFSAPASFAIPGGGSQGLTTGGWINRI